jgi:NADH-quinone oxidoreductase subunit M
MTLAVLLVPLLASILVALLPGVGAQRLLALLAALATFALALLLPGDPGVSWSWIPGFGATFSLSPSGAGSVLVLAAALTMIPTIAYAGVRVEQRTGGMLALLLAMQAGLNGLFLAKDLVVFYVFWEAALIPSLLMLGIWGGERRRQAVLKYLVYAVAGSFMMLIAILALKPLSGAASYHVVDLLAATPSLPVRTQIWLFLGFALAFAVKLPLMPVHSWLIDFHEQNHPSGVADVAGTLYKVGGFGFFAWALPLLPAGALAVGPWLLALAAITALYAGVIAARQTDLKRLLAYVSLAHMGVVGVGIFGLNLAGPTGAMYLLAAQLLSTGGLFLLSGMLHERGHSFDLDRYGGLARSAPAMAAVFLLILFASIGVPGLSNFPGEFLSLLGGFQGSVFWTAVATLSVVAAGVVGVNLYQRLFQGREAGTHPDLRSVEILVLIPILSGVLWLGLTPAPQLERIEVQSQITRALLVDAGAPDTPLLTLGGER